MDEVRLADRKIFAKQFLRFPQSALLAVAVVAASIGLGHPMMLTFAVFSVLVAILGAYFETTKRRFISMRFEMLWKECADRRRRFHAAHKAMQKRDLAQFTEMPRTLDAVADSLYLALRRADLTAHEVSQSEGCLIESPVVALRAGEDRQAQELYRLADRNRAEYRRHLEAVSGGVQRAEAQAAVFITTLDTLRVKMLGYRLTGRRPELSSQEFLESMLEAKLQFEAIDKALDELELTPFPKTISLQPTWNEALASENTVDNTHETPPPFEQQMLGSEGARLDGDSAPNQFGP